MGFYLSIQNKCIQNPLLYKISIRKGFRLPNPLVVFNMKLKGLSNFIVVIRIIIIYTIIMPTLLIILSKTILFYKIFSILKYLFNYTLIKISN